MLMPQTFKDVSLPFWERPDVVEMFADRPPDTRMLALLEGAPKETRVLDLGCAGGRNSLWLAEQGFDFYAVDTSRAMLAKTCKRVAEVVGQAEAEARVLGSRMDSLSRFAEGSFDLVLAFGIYQGAQSEAEWHRAVAETARVLRPGGELLVAHFSPDSDPTGEGVHVVDGERRLYTGLSAQRRILLLQAHELDAWLARHGLEPLTPTSSVRVTFDEGYRTTVNGHYLKSGVRKVLEDRP
jgi:SAM-dependent methyltransferase